MAILYVIETDVKDVAMTLAARFCDRAKAEYGSVERKERELNRLLDEIEGLPFEHDYGLDARKAAGRGLKVCFSNLPHEPELSMALQARIIQTAALVGCRLTRD